MKLGELIIKLQEIASMYGDDLPVHAPTNHSDTDVTKPVTKVEYSEFYCCSYIKTVDEPCVIISDWEETGPDKT
jgi:hypothetical protein